MVWNSGYLLSILKTPVASKIFPLCGLRFNVKLEDCWKTRHEYSPKGSVLSWRISQGKSGCGFFCARREKWAHKSQENIPPPASVISKIPWCLSFKLHHNSSSPTPAFWLLHLKSASEREIKQCRKKIFPFSLVTLAEFSVHWKWWRIFVPQKGWCFLSGFRNFQIVSQIIPTSLDSLFLEKDWKSCSTWWLFLRTQWKSYRRPHSVLLPIGVRWLKPPNCSSFYNSDRQQDPTFPVPQTLEIPTLT